MQKKKDTNLIDKLVKKNYKNELEKVLEDKFFDETAKSLLLEILYKIETSYKDYSTVKKDTITKEEYLENFIKIIKCDCKTIKIVKPKSEQSKLLNNRTFMVKKEKKEIICLPIARKLLYSVSKIGKKDIIVKDKYFLLSRTLSDLINVGNNINTVEPLRDFNGWSWTVVPKEIESIEHNLVYQIMTILIGTKFLNIWIKNEEFLIDYVEEFQNKFESKYGKKRAEKFMKSLYKLSVLIELKVDKDVREQIDDSRREIEEKLAKFENKEQFVEELTFEKNELKDKIKEIDTTINNKDLLEQEYIKRNENLPLENKIFSMRILTDIMSKEREEVLNKLEKINDLLKPSNFISNKKELERELKYLDLALVDDEESELKEELNNFQKIFLECFKIKIEKAETKEDLIKLIYEYRYYCLLPYNEDEVIFETRELNKKLTEIGELLIQKAIEQKAMKAVSDNRDLNYKIVKNIFAVKIIELEELSIKITKEKEQYFMQFFDENVFEETIKLDIKEKLNKKDLNMRLNKKVKLFE